MSPYLFIICMEVLFSVLCEGENKGVFGGVKVNHSVPSVSHLIFAYSLVKAGDQLFKFLLFFH